METQVIDLGEVQEVIATTPLTHESALQWAARLRKHAEGLAATAERLLAEAEAELRAAELLISASDPASSIRS